MILHRLASIAQGKPARNWAEVQATDDALLEQEVTKLAAMVAGGQSGGARAGAATDGSGNGNGEPAASTHRSAYNVGSSPAQAMSADNITSTVLTALKTWSGPERWLDLALRTGPYGDLFGMKLQGVNLTKLAATPAGIDLGALQPRLPGALRTPSGKVELVPSPLLADLARAASDLDAPVPDLVVIGRRDVRSNNSWMHNLPTLAKGPFRGALQLHPADAARLGLVDGARARLARANAKDRHVDVDVALDAGLLPGVCCLPHGWGHNLPGTKLGLAAERPGANLNAVLDENLRDPLSGNAVLSGVAVTLHTV
jgi:anaerobic selenocysteine-containing dehydrogenase